MKDIVNFPTWQTLLVLYKMSRTDILVFNMFISDSERFSCGPSLMFKKFGGRLHRTHIARAYRNLERVGFIRKTGEIRPNKRGKGTPVYILNYAFFNDSVKTYLKDDQDLGLDNGPINNGPKHNGPKHNGPESIESAIGPRLDDVSSTSTNVAIMDQNFVDNGPKNAR